MFLVCSYYHRSIIIMCFSQGFFQNALSINHTPSVGPKLSPIYLWKRIAAAVTTRLISLS